jgi:hypothetical protein
MPETPTVEPLPYQARSRFFYLLLTLFAVALPFLLLYATGYRFNFTDNAFISTGGLYIAAERTGAEIYIDNELVRETRVFRRAFYAQSIEPGTHRIHVQKDDHHTWVKQLPVYPHLVTEAQAFNMPLTPQVRLISPWRTATGATVLFATSTVQASTTNAFVIATSTATTTLVADTEFASLIELFILATTTPATTTNRFVSDLATATTPTTSDAVLATTTVTENGVQLYEADGEVYARFVGAREQMPYYYCAESFELLPATSTPTSTRALRPEPLAAAAVGAEEFDPNVLLQPVQTIAPETDCEPVIQIDRQGAEVVAFDFYPGSTDFVVLARSDGVFVTEVDNRAWQNTQPLLLGTDLDMRVEGNSIYVYDGTLVYRIERSTS